jgi:NADPH:quinone reductase
MRAWVAPRYGPPGVLTLRDVPDPVAGPGEVLVRVRAIGLNFADCAARMGVYPRVPRPPFVPGMEIAGEIAAVGSGVADATVGEAVAAVPIFGGHAELVRVTAARVRPLPRGIGFASGAALAVTALTADHALFTIGRLRAGERVLLNAAAGGVGTMAVQLAARARATIVAVASTDEKRRLASRLGAQETWGYEHWGRAAGAGVDLVLDSVGGGCFSAAWRRLRPDGRYVLFGFAAAVGRRRIRYAAAAAAFLRMGWIVPAALISRSRTLAGFNLSLVPSLTAHLGRRLAALERLVVDGELETVIGATFPFERLPEAHALLQARGSSGKVVVEVG